MVQINIKNKDYNISLTKDSFNRRATQYTNKIIEKFKSIGLKEDDLNISEERAPIRNLPASISWWIDGYHCHFSHAKQNKYVDNLLVVSKIIEDYINKFIQEEITLTEFIETFKEKDDVTTKRKEARDFFDLEETHTDFESINKKYKLLSKKLHPDMPTGNIDKFKELNEHHKILKRELE